MDNKTKITKYVCEAIIVIAIVLGVVTCHRDTVKYKADKTSTNQTESK